MLDMQRRLISFLGIIFLSIALIDGKAQGKAQSFTSKRDKENFDFNWQFHKGDIAIKLVARVGQGGITDVNVPVISKKDTVLLKTGILLIHTKLHLECGPLKSTAMGLMTTTRV